MIKHPVLLFSFLCTFLSVNGADALDKLLANPNARRYGVLAATGATLMNLWNTRDLNTRLIKVETAVSHFATINTHATAAGAGAGTAHAASPRLRALPNASPARTASLAASPVRAAEAEEPNDFEARLITIKDSLDELMDKAKDGHELLEDQMHCMGAELFGPQYQDDDYSADDWYTPDPRSRIGNINARLDQLEETARALRINLHDMSTALMHLRDNIKETSLKDSKSRPAQSAPHARGASRGEERDLAKTIGLGSLDPHESKAGNQADAAKAAAHKARRDRLKQKVQFQASGRKSLQRAAAAANAEWSDGEEVHDQNPNDGNTAKASAAGAGAGAGAAAQQGKPKRAAAAE